MKQRELAILSELSTVSIKNDSNVMELTLLPLLKELLVIVGGHQPPNTVATAGVGAATSITESATVLNLSRSTANTNPSSRTVIVKERPLEIIIEKTVR